jgi:hypothetical protein
LRRDTQASARNFAAKNFGAAKSPMGKEKGSGNKRAEHETSGAETVLHKVFGVASFAACRLT